VTSLSLGHRWVVNLHQKWCQQA